MSVFGVLFSTLAVLLFKKTTKMSPIGISVASALFHNIGQVFALIYINKSIGMIYWLPIMLFSAIPTGLLTGYVSLLVLKRFRCSPKLLNLD
jgi:heptaprenyl diphosphate synthase